MGVRFLGPLDQHHKTGYRVYYVLKKTIHADYMGKAGRERTVSSDFFEQFENFRFVNENRWKEHIDVPKIKYLQLKRSWKSKGNDIYRLKIAVVRSLARRILNSGLSGKVDML